MSGLAVVHLASASLGSGPLRRFVESYRRHAAGVGHTLVVAFNGSRAEDGAPELFDAAAPLDFEPWFLGDQLLDVAAYRRVAAGLAESSVCFLNSTSVILSPRWLATMDSHLHAEGVGLVGASGSWESQFSSALRRPARDYASGRTSALGRKAIAIYRAGREFPRFPNHHIRTNAFMMSRARFLALSPAAIERKIDAYRFESGHASLTRRVLGTGLAVRVIGRDGLAYPPEDWVSSGTFRSCGQSNLLVSDRRTEDYASASPEEREALGRAAWGDAWVP